MSNEEGDRLQQLIREEQQRINRNVQRLEGHDRRAEVRDAYIVVRKLLRQRGVVMMWGDDAHDGLFEDEVENGGSFQFSSTRRVPDTVVVPRKEAPIRALPTRNPALRLALLLEQYYKCGPASKARRGAVARAPNNATDQRMYADLIWAVNEHDTVYRAKQYANIQLFSLLSGQPFNPRLHLK